MSRLIDLVQEKKWKLEHLEIKDEAKAIEAVRRRGNAYALNAQGALIALSMTNTDIDSLILGKECQELEHLYLGYNEKLTQIEFETNLPKLQYLYLNNCALNSTLRLPEGLANLKQVYVQKNQLQGLVFEGDCPELELLDAAENGMTVLSMPNGFLNLKYLHLQKNQIAQLPYSFVGMRHLELLFLAGNPLANIPQEVIGSGEEHNSAKELLAYLSSIQGKKTQYLHEAKMILVGNPMVGKSSIRIKLNDPQAELPKIEDRTPGLDVEPYILKNLPPTLTEQDQAIDFQLNIWDFGGQGRYREIQQLFCSRKSLYVYVTAYDDQPEKEDYIGLDYWLSMVNAYGFDQEEKTASPVIYVLNKIDVKDPGINETLNQEKYQNIVKFAKISCAQYSGFEQLITYFRDTLPLVSKDIFSNRYSPDWFRVKQRLESFTKNHILYLDFIGICREEGLDLEQSQTWLTVLDRIGTVIYMGNFQNEQEWVILNPNWVKDAICKVIDSPLMQRDGILRPAYVDAIWSDYPDPADRENLVKLMLDEKYKLAYVLPSDEGVTEYMVPSALFQKVKPALGKYLHLHAPANYAFQFRFAPFIPAGIVNKLMVTLNSYIYNDLIWGNGCILHDGASNTYVTLQEDWEKRVVQAEFIGLNAEGFYGTLVSTLQRITEDIKSSKLLTHLDFTEWMQYDGQFLEKELLKKFGHFPWKDERLDAFRGGDKYELKLENTMDEIKKLIGKSKLKEALGALENVLTGEEKDEVFLLQGRLEKLEQKERKGIINDENARIERLSIADTALQLCSLPPKERQEESLVPPLPTTPKIIANTSSMKKIFFSYSKSDRDYLDQLLKHLSPLARNNKIESWKDDEILPGEEWDDAIREELHAADIILLLVSSDFMATEYIWKVEIATAMQRHERGEARVIPIIIRRCSWESMPFSKLNGLPSKAKPVNSYSDRDEAWLEVVKGIERVLDK